MDTDAASDLDSREADLAILRLAMADEAAELRQNPVSRRRLARDVAEMVNQPYPNTRLIPQQDSLIEACLLLDTGTRIVHVTLVFRAGYPDTALHAFVDGRKDVEHPDGTPCAEVLAYGSSQRQAYTIKTVALHLLSMFDGDKELVQNLHGEEMWLPSQWADFSCKGCGYPQVSCNTHRQDAKEDAVAQPMVAGNPLQSKGIRDLPNELLKRTLEYLEVEDIVRLGQAWRHIQDIVEEDVVVRDRELQCFVTKEHFTRSPLGIGIYLPLLPRPVVAIESEFDLISRDAYRQLGVHNTAYGCKTSDWLPLPLSERHWDRVKADAYLRLRQLADKHSGRQLGDLGQRERSADLVDILTAFMEDHTIKLFTNVSCSPTSARAGGLLRPSEKGIESLFFIFHLLLCVAVDHPDQVDKANKMLEAFQAGGAPARDTPSPGRILATLLISDAKTDADLLPKLFFEALTRNVPLLLMAHPELEYLEPDGAASPYRLHHTFADGLASYRALMLMDVFRREARSATTGDTLEEKRDYLFRRRGMPPSAALASLAAELPRIAAVDSFPRMLDYLGIYRGAGGRSLAGRLRDAVRECVIIRELRRPWPLGRQVGAVLRRAAEERWPLFPVTEGLPPYPAVPVWMGPELAQVVPDFWTWFKPRPGA